jgi:GAF domain-containing protein
VTRGDEIETSCCRLRLGQITRVEFIERCVRLASSNLGASRSALWIFIDTASGRALRCVAMHDRASDVMVSVRPHTRESADLFFDELSNSGQVVAHDARSHPATRGFFADVPAARSVQSLIATPFSVNGRLFGAFACTQLGDCVHWSPQQLFMLRRIGIRATLAIAALGPRETALLTQGW